MALLNMPAWVFLKKLAKRISDNAVTDRAATLAYYFVFALFPFLFTLVTLAAFLPVQSSITDLLARLDPLMPEEAMGIIRTQLNALTTQHRPRLLAFGLFLAIWRATRTGLSFLMAGRFSGCAETWGSYATSCGAGGGMIVRMAWFYISGFVSSLGGELNALLERAPGGGRGKGARAPGEAPAPAVE